MLKYWRFSDQYWCLSNFGQTYPIIIHSKLPIINLYSGVQAKLYKCLIKFAFGQTLCLSTSVSLFQVLNLAALLCTISSILCLVDGEILPWTCNMFRWLHLAWLIINFCQEIRIAQKAGPANVLPKTITLTRHKTTCIKDTVQNTKQSNTSKK